MYYSRANTIFLSKGNRADTIRGRPLFDVRVLFKEIRYMYTYRLDECMEIRNLESRGPCAAAF